MRRPCRPVTRIYAVDNLVALSARDPFQRWHCSIVT